MSRLDATGFYLCDDEGMPFTGPWPCRGSAEQALEKLDALDLRGNLEPFTLKTLRERLKRRRGGEEVKP